MEEYGIRGSHVTADFYGVHKAMLDDEDFLKRHLASAAIHCGATVLQLNSEKFEPSGVTCAHILSESHITCHTYPDQQFIAIDVYTCGMPNPEVAIDILRTVLMPRHYVIKIIERGTEDYSLYLD